MASIAYQDGQGNIRQRDITATSAGTTANPDVFTVSVVNTELTAVGLQADTAATSNAGSFSLVSLFKRYLDLFTALGVGSVSDTAATSDTGSFSLVSLFKRYLTLSAKPNILQSNGTLANTTGTDIAAAPGSGNRIYLTYLVFQNISATTTTINVRSGTTTNLSVVLTQNSTYSIVFPEKREFGLATNTAFNLQATTANAIVYSVGYYTGT